MTVAFLGTMGIQLNALLKPLGVSQHYDIGEFEGALIWAFIMPRDASLSDSGSNFFQFDGYSQACFL